MAGQNSCVDILSATPQLVANLALAMFRPRAGEYLMKAEWKFDEDNVSWVELSDLYRIAPLGEKKPEDLKLVFSNSRYKCFVYSEGRLVGAGRALADGLDCSYICDVAVHPGFQGLGLGKDIVSKLCQLSSGHKKIVLYSVPGKEGFYKSLGFKRMSTAMAIFAEQDQALQAGLINET
jgi:ribosomal protein S18 acetylase RimI-like enzyme